MSGTDIRRYLANWQAEVDSTEQYLAMATHEPDPGTARVYQNLAEIERKHADFWETRLRAAGHDPGPRNPSWRARVLVFLRGAGARSRYSKPWPRMNTRARTTTCRRRKPPLPP